MMTIIVVARRPELVARLATSSHTRPPREVEDALVPPRTPPNFGKYCEQTAALRRTGRGKPPFCENWHMRSRSRCRTKPQLCRREPPTRAESVAASCRAASRNQRHPNRVRQERHTAGRGLRQHRSFSARVVCSKRRVRRAVTRARGR